MITALVCSHLVYLAIAAMLWRRQWHRAHVAGSIAFVPPIVLLHVAGADHGDPTGTLFFMLEGAMFVAYKLYLVRRLALRMLAARTAQSYQYAPVRIDER